MAMNERAVRKLWICILLLLLLVANSPLFYILWLHDWKTVLRIIGHAPNQFLFLLVFWPAALWAAFKSFNETMKIADDHLKLKEAAFWKILIKRGVLVASSVIIALSFAAVEYKFTPPDFYQLKPNLAKKAASLNQSIIVALATKAQDKASLQVHQQIIEENKQTLLAIYKSHGQVDKILVVLEFLELAAVLFMVSIAIWTGFLNLKMIRYANSNFLPAEAAQTLKTRLIQIIPYSVVAILVYLFWPPLRLYNIYEIRKVFVDYQTIDPTFGYVVAAIFSIALCWLYYHKSHPQFFKMLSSIITFFASGALMGFVKLKPESLVEVIGSGMGAGNLFTFVFVVGLAYLFGSEILQQMRLKG
jgi:hypothetical protein